MAEQEATTLYEQIVRGYLESPEEAYLYQAAQLGQRLLQEEVPPEAIVEMHAQAVETITEGFALAEQMEAVKQLLAPLMKAVRQSFPPLMEAMMAYGLAFRWYGQLQREIARRKQAEEELRQTVAELERTNAELELFNRLAVGRELRMIELKRQINELSEQLGKEPPYDLSLLGEWERRTDG